jgi:hypothetical protein
MLGGQIESWTVGGSLMLDAALVRDEVVTYPGEAFVYCLARHAVVLEIYKSYVTESFVNLARDLFLLFLCAARGFGEVDDRNVCHAANLGQVTSILAEKHKYGSQE